MCALTPLGTPPAAAWMRRSGRQSLWKKEIYVGGEEWIGSEAQYQRELAEGSAR